MRDFSYEHAITGVKIAETPVETLGGILADDMGLGKTLTVLSTMLRTASISRSFAEENNQNATKLEGKGGNLNQILSRATLVIAPSSRKWFLP
jgi:SWI/SNF-related matrix-associated actin-dependent regulator of chromatin subfamily A3